MCDIGQRNVNLSSRTTFPLAESIGRGGEMMEIEDWLTLIDDIVKKRWSPLILLTGTEPFLYPHLHQLIEYIVAKGLRLHITTNGALLSRFARQLVDFCKNPDSISITVSLDGIGEVHDKIRGVTGTFDKAIAGLSEVAERRREMGKSYPEVGITYAISNFNYRHMRDFVQWFQDEDLGITSINFSHLWFKDNEIVKNHNKEYGDRFPVSQENITGLNISEIDMDFVHNELREIRKNYAQSPFSIYEHPELTYEEERKYYSKTTELVYNNRCLAPWRNVSVTPRGEVIISPMCLDYPLGNVKKDSFSHIWNDVPLRYFRKELKKAGVYPACTRCCMLFDSKPKYYKLKELIK
jgi:MoaA/NifB/PqqE/SkfB family radical SAM enzyme